MFKLTDSFWADIFVVGIRIETIKTETIKQNIKDFFISPPGSSSIVKGNSKFKELGLFFYYKRGYWILQQKNG
jgi:hypothetical protein